MAKYIDKSALVAEINRIKKEECPVDTYEGRIKLFYFEQFLSFLDSLEVKEVDLEKELPKVWDRETLDEYAYQVAYDLSNDWMKETATWDDVETAVKLGAKWQKEHLWKPADGGDLPEIDREVIVLTQKYPLKGSEYAVSFAHRPYKGKYIGKNLTTGNIETFENETYGKGGWSIPDVKFWLDCEWPNKEK